MEITCRKTFHFCWNVFVFLKNGHSLSWIAFFFTTFFTGIESGKKTTNFHNYSFSSSLELLSSLAYLESGIEIRIPNVFFWDRDRNQDSERFFSGSGSKSGSRTFFSGIGIGTGSILSKRDRDRDPVRFFSGSGPGRVFVERDGIGIGTKKPVPQDSIN